MPSQGVTNVANAIINKINNLISSHNSNSNAHQDIRNSIPKIFYAACDCSEQNELIELECEDWNTEQGNIIYVRFNNVENHYSTYVMDLSINEELIPVHKTIDFYNNITPLILFRDAVVKFTCYFIDENTPIFLYEFPTLTSELYNDIGFITSSSVPSASSATPLSDTQNGGVGTGTTWARSDHTHPKSSLYEDNTNKVTSLSSSSTDTQYPSAKAVYDATLNLDTLDCINENFTLLSLPQIILTYNEDEFDAIEVALLHNYPKGAYVDWGDGTSIETYVGNDILKHDYLDNIQEHTIIIYGDILNDILSSYSFYDLTGMTSINIPSMVEGIATHCFDGCTGLTSINIPSTVKLMASYCFNGCTGLNTIILNWTELPLISYPTLMLGSPSSISPTFSIPYGTTSLYESRGYPTEKLVERSE